ncbi:MAG: xanthine dehydrogenase family protein subunit M [Chloroflexi bacterium]|nr:xanthine dehydrogenase family protein subunit M [Chloroflexota bacterium]
MKPAPFKYYAPTTVEEALAHLAEHGYDAKPLAGGQSLVPTMNFRLSQPAVLVDLNNVGELFYIRPNNENGGLRMGAMTRQTAVEYNDLVAERSPLFHGAMPSIGFCQTRNRGTIGGSLAHADPAAELSAVTVALGARFRLRSQSKERWVSATEFFMGPFFTALDVGELLVEIELPPKLPHSGWFFKEITRRHHDFAMAGVAVLVTLDDDMKKCEQAKVILFSVGDGPVVARQAAAILKGQAPTPEAIQAAAETAARDDIDPSGDIHASVEYRRHLAKVLTRQGLTQAFEHARGGAA